MKCIIIEDEKSGQELLSYKLKLLFPAIEIIHIIDNKDEAVHFLNNNYVDFIFLDIEIKGGKGTDILKNLNSINFEIIFTTAYNEYMQEAFDLGALHYLMKPFKDDDLKNAVNRVLKRKISHPESKSYIITHKNELKIIKFSEILYLKSDGAYTEFFTENKKLISTKNLGEIERELDATMFIRTHHSYIINKQKIEKIEKGRNGNVFLSGNHIVPISQRKMSEFLNSI